MMVESPMILAIDIGTSSVRVSLFDAQARALPGLYAQSSYQLRTTPDGGATLDPDEVCQQLFECLDRVIDQAGDRANDIVAAGCCTLVANVLGVDDQGQAITPLYTWADARGREAVEWLRAGLDENEVHQRTGCLLHTSYLSTRLRWIQSARPELFRQVQQWLSIDDYLRLRLFGQSSTSYSVASWTGLLNRHSLQWDEPLLAHVGHLRSASTPTEGPGSGAEWIIAQLRPALASAGQHPLVSGIRGRGRQQPGRRGRIAGSICGQPGHQRGHPGNCSGFPGHGAGRAVVLSYRPRPFPAGRRAEQCR